MAEGDHPELGAAAYLAGWIEKVDLGQLKTCYELCRPPSARMWSLIVEKGGENVILEACREASEKAFIDKLSESIARLEQEAGRPSEDVAALLAKTAATGQMQAIVNSKSMTSAEAIWATSDALKACAIVCDGDAKKGTAFLVRPDMVLTAAHVVFASKGQNWADPPSLLDDLNFRFLAPDNGAKAGRVTVYPSPTGALCASSPPYGPWPDILAVDVAPPTEPTLDYALIRLARRVEHIKPVPVDPPKGVELKQRCWAMGFVGGDALVCDDDEVADAQHGGGRWLHLANTTPGMSGGCCMNHNGKLAGIHEGAVEVILKPGQPRAKFNRGVEIAAIRAHMQSGGKDPLAANSATQGVEFDDPELVRGLHRAGSQLAGPGDAPVWDGWVRKVLDADPNDTATLPGFHPWFEREEFEHWIAKPKQRERLCLIGGQRGAGASFCKQILRAMLDPAASGYLSVDSTEVAAFSPKEAVGLATAPSPTRTGSANFRYNDATELIAGLRAERGDEQTGTVAIDFGPHGGTARLANAWQEFVVQLLAEDWIRVVLIGLTLDEREVLREAIEKHSAIVGLRPKEIELDPIGADEFRAYASDLVDARGIKLAEARPDAEAELMRRIDAVLKPDPTELPQLQTAMFALAAIAFEKDLPFEKGLS